MTPLPGIRRPLTARSTLGNNFGGNWGFLQDNDHTGIISSHRRRPVENQHIMLSSFQSTSSMLSSAMFTDDLMTRPERNVNFDDYLNMDVSDDDEAEAPTPDAAFFSPPNTDYSNEWAVGSSPMTRPGSSSFSGGQYIPQPGSVSSFRNNQRLALHVSSLPSNPQRRAEMSECNAMQKGRRNAANTPMTPARKKRMSQDLTGAGIKKVGANSPLVAKHRRSSRGSSLSGANLLANLSIDHIASANQSHK